MTDYNELKRSLSRRGMRPALDGNGEPFLTRTATTPGVTFISAEQLVDELNKRGKRIDTESLVLSNIVPDVIAPPKAPAPEPEPAPEPKPKPAPKKSKPKKAEVWTEEELEEVPWKDLRKLAKLWPDVHGNKGKEHIIEGLVGKPKSGPSE